MKPNGRRAWRKAAKKLRWKMGRRWRSQEEWVHGKRWSELVPDLEAHRAHITGTWFKRHGFQSFDAESSSRHYIGLWGSANGETIGFVESASSITARSLVGMTQGAKKRAIRRCEQLDLDPVHRLWFRLGQRLRPCPGCSACARPCHYCEMQEPDDSRCPRCRQVMYSTPICDGSGVLPARGA